jgi:hypothetical protein
MYCTVCQQEYIFLNIFWRARVYWPLHCSVLGIRDILVPIRIQLLSSVTTGTLSSVLKINFMKNCVKILFCKHYRYFSPLNTFMRKRKDPEPDPDPCLLLTDPDQGGPKSCGSCESGSGSGSASRPGSPTLPLLISPIL